MVNNSYCFEFLIYFREVLLWPRTARDWYILVKEVRSHPTGLQARHGSSTALNHHHSYAQTQQ